MDLLSHTPFHLKQFPCVSQYITVVCVVFYSSNSGFKFSAFSISIDQTGSVREGSNFTLSCSAQNTDNDFTILQVEWFWQNVTAITNGSGVTVQSFEDDSLSTINFNPLIPLHEGVYRCRVHYDHGNQTNFASVISTVTFASEVITNNEKVR